jgi:hypothetical protein
MIQIYGKVDQKEKIFFFVYTSKAKKANTKAVPSLHLMISSMKLKHQHFASGHQT